MQEAAGMNRRREILRAFAMQAIFSYDYLKKEGIVWTQF